VYIVDASSSVQSQGEKYASLKQKRWLKVTKKVTRSMQKSVVGSSWWTLLLGGNRVPLRSPPDCTGTDKEALSSIPSHTTQRTVHASTEASMPHVNNTVKLQVIARSPGLVGADL